jgi:hypothetical protein
MNTQQANTAHSLYVLYDTLPNEVQQAFLEELKFPSFLGGSRACRGIY